MSSGDRRGNQNPSGTDRTRTYWTPPMDRCFIDLLLEQVKKGNKLGQTFITHAWNDMITSFNKRFKSHHDKDVLKNRYKHLRRQFKDVDNLLQQSGFSWDDTREMIAAEDYIWDAYTKVHPEARPLRVKTLPGYRKLCVIFGEECSDRRYSHLARVADPTGELPALIAGEEKNGNFHSVYDAASTIEWTESMECFFIELMIEQVNQGNRVRNRFNEQAWTHMIEAFSAKLGLQCDKQFLEDQYFCLMKRHDDISSLLNHDGFTWDETLQMVVAENDIWEAYIKDHPAAISYRNRFLDPYRDLCKIFGNKVSDARVWAQGQIQWIEANNITIQMDRDGTCGNLVVTNNTEISGQDTERPSEKDRNRTSRKSVVIRSTEILAQDNEKPNEMDLGGASVNLTLTGNTGISDQDIERARDIDMDGISENLVVTGSTEIKECDKKRPCKMPSRTRPLNKKPKKDLRMQEALSNMADAVKKLMNKETTQTSNDKSFENALSALQAMPDIDEELIMDACDLLEDEKKAKTFLALDVSLRKKWLLRKLRS